MSERKVQCRYIDPNFNYEKLVKVKKSRKKQDNVRMMLPFSVKCKICGNYLRIGTKINMRKEKVENESYLTIPIYRFYMKCLTCYAEMTMKTDPKNNDYVMEHGASRLYESWKDARAAEELVKQIRDKDEEGNTITKLENKTYDSKKEMDMLEAIDEIRAINRLNSKVDTTKVLEFLNKRDYTLNDEDIKSYLSKAIKYDAEKVKGTDSTPVNISMINRVLGDELEDREMTNREVGKDESCNKIAIEVTQRYCLVDDEDNSC